MRKCVDEKKEGDKSLRGGRVKTASLYQNEWTVQISTKPELLNP